MLPVYSFKNHLDMVAVEQLQKDFGNKSEINVLLHVAQNITRDFFNYLCFICIWHKTMVCFIFV